MGERMRNVTGPFAVKFVLEGKRQNDFLPGGFVSNVTGLKAPQSITFRYV